MTAAIAGEDLVRALRGVTVSLDAKDVRVQGLWRPPIRLDLSEWADAHFQLPEGDANAGRWRSLPHQRGIMDAISDSRIERVSVKKSARVGFTLGCICAAVGYFIEHDPAPMLLVQPTIDDAKRFSKEQIAPTLEIPALRARVAEVKSRSSSRTLTHISFTGGVLALVGANSPRGFRRASYRVVIFDEVDGYPPSAGAEGDQIELGIRRTEHYWNRKIVAGSTPTDDGVSRIDKLFREGDQRRYRVPCPHCGAMQVLEPDNLKWPEGHPERARFICTARGCEIEHQHKRDMIEGAYESQRGGGLGGWVAEAPNNFHEYNRHASFHLWAAYSFSPNASWAQIAIAWVKAVAGGALTHKTFKNTWLGATWKVDLVAVVWDTLYRRREDYAIGTAPAGVLFLVAGVDVQKDRLVYEVVGYGRGKTSWSIDYGILPGDTADLEGGPWKQLSALLARSFPTSVGVDLRIGMLAVDGRYNTQTVFAWARPFGMGRVIVAAGQGGRSSLIVGTPRPVEVNVRGRMRRGFKSWPVYGHTAKDELFGWLGLEAPLHGPPAPGYCHFPEYDEEYFRQLTAETLRVSQDGRRYEYQVIEGRENHVLDGRIYARAAASVLGLDRFAESDWIALERALGLAPGATQIFEDEVPD